MSELVGDACYFRAGQSVDDALILKNHAQLGANLPAGESFEVMTVRFVRFGCLLPLHRGWAPRRPYPDLSADGVIRSISLEGHHRPEICGGIPYKSDVYVV